jgi:pyroglutamyl-peptidase
MRTLVTGFEPWAQHAVNPSMEVVNALRPSGDLITRVLPVVYDEAGRAVRELIERERPDAVLSLGLCARSPSILLERIAVNMNDDPAGDRTNDRVIDPAGPAAYWSTLPLSAMYVALRERGIPVAWSNHAGTYVCNHVFYTARRAIEQLGGGQPCGFVHLPPLGVGGVPLEVLVGAVETCLEVLARSAATK